MEKVENMEKVGIDADLVNAVVTYWSGFIKDPMSFEMDNGEPSQYAMINMLAKMGAKPGDPIMVEKFESILCALVYNELEEKGRVTLSVDYDPHGLLRQALDQTFGERNYNSKSIFPCKTTMWITDKIVTYSQGYRAMEKVLYPNEMGSN